MRDALATVLATAAGVEPFAVALSIDRAAAVPAEDADATRALLSAGLFARAKQFWVAAVQPVLPDGWFLMEQLHGRSYYYHKSGASQFNKPTAWVPDEEPDPEDDWEPCPAICRARSRDLRAKDIRAVGPGTASRTAHEPDKMPAFGWGTVSAYD